jgi:hypothetical protein
MPVKTTNVKTSKLEKGFQSNQNVGFPPVYRYIAHTATNDLPSLEVDTPPERRTENALMLRGDLVAGEFLDSFFRAVESLAFTAQV